MASDEKDQNFQQETEKESWLVGGDGITLSKNKAVYGTASGKSCFGTKTVKNGSWVWTVKCNYGMASCQWIGVCTNRKNINTTFYTPFEIHWCNNCKKIQANLGHGHKASITAIDGNHKCCWNRGDEITIKLDIDNKNIEFYRNIVDNPKCVAQYNELPDVGNDSDGYRIAVYGYAGDVFEIMASQGGDLTNFESCTSKPSESIRNEINQAIESLGNIQRQIKSNKYTMKQLLKGKEMIGKAATESNQILKQFETFQTKLDQTSAMIDKQLVVDPKNFQEWDVTKAVQYICGLQNGKFSKYYEMLIKAFTEQEITGKDLISIDKNDLFTFGIKKFSDRKDIFQELQKLLCVEEGQLTGNIMTDL